MEKVTKIGDYGILHHKLRESMIGDEVRSKQREVLFETDG